jgi:hypothetical protein
VENFGFGESSVVARRLTNFPTYPVYTCRDFHRIQFALIYSLNPKEFSHVSRVRLIILSCNLRRFATENRDCVTTTFAHIL